MTDIAELESRISAALDRIGAGLGALNTAEPTGADAGELTTLRDALADEKIANAQLEERVKAMHHKHSAAVASAAAEIATLQEKLDALGDDMARLQAVNAQLRANNQALRDANETGVGNPELINEGMQAELASLRASRDGDRAELDAILGELKPLVEGHADA